MNKNLLIKYIQTQVNQQEKLEVEEWTKASNSNKKYLEQLSFLWQAENEYHTTPSFDTDKAWLNFQSKMNVQNDEKAKIFLSKNHTPFKSIISAAAAIMVLLIGFWWLKWSNNTTIYSTRKIEEITLADNSKITLNTHSSLSYDRQFNKKDRTITLKGEAFFNVAKNKQKPFIVKVGDINVTVTGTSFNIRSSVDETTIIVETGSVKVTRMDKEYLLSPNDKITFKGASAKASLEQSNNQLYQYYRTHVFVCDRTTVAQLAEGLSQAYNVKIIIGSQELESKLLTSKYAQSDSIEQILQNVALTLNVSVEKKGSVYILK